MSYQHTQIGDVILVLTSVIVSFQTSIIYIVFDITPTSQWLVAAIVNLSVLIIGRLFSTLTIKIDKQCVTWHFTFVFWKRSIKKRRRH
jgi:hypothetical protein